MKDHGVLLADLEEEATEFYLLSWEASLDDLWTVEDGIFHSYVCPDEDSRQLKFGQLGQ